MKKRQRIGRDIHPDFKTQYKIIVVKTMCYWYKDKWRQIRSSEINLDIYNNQLIFDMGAEKIEKK